MKRQGFTLVLFGWFAGAFLFGQQPMNAPRELIPAQPVTAGITPADDKALSMEFQKRFVHMTKRYKLTAGQQAQVHSILQQEERDAQLANADTLMSPSNKRAEVADLFEASQQKIGAILTKEQKHKFDADEKRRAWMDGRLPEPNPGPALGGW